MMVLSVVSRTEFSFNRLNSRRNIVKPTGSDALASLLSIESNGVIAEQVGADG